MTRPQWWLAPVGLIVLLVPTLFWAIQIKGHIDAVCSQGLDAGQEALSAPVGYASGASLGPLSATPAAGTTPSPVLGGALLPYPAPQMTASAAVAPSPYGGTYPTPDFGTFGQGYPVPTAASTENKAGSGSNVVLGISFWQLGAGAVVGLAVGFVLGRRGKSG